MIYGVGVDSVQVARMARSLQRHRFAARVFGAAERGWLQGLAPHRRAQSAAACFAAKEAFLKALGLGLGGCPLADIQALRKPTGAPYLHLEGAAKALCAGKGLAFHLSLTHEGGCALAFVVAEQKA